MQRDDAPMNQAPAALAVSPDDRSSRSPISVAILAALAFMPIVVAAGFLTDRSTVTSVPADISAVALRGVFDGESAGALEAGARAGY